MGISKSENQLGFTRVSRKDTIDLQSREIFSEIVLDTTASPNDYPSDYNVLVSNVGNNWDTVASGNNNSAVATISFSQQNARYIRVEQNSTSDRFWWSIHEINVFASASSPTNPTEPPQPPVGNCSGDIQDCIDNLSSGSVVLDEKTYKLHSSLILKSNVNLIGQGSGTVITWDDSIADTVNAPLIYKEDSKHGSLANVRLEDFRVKCTVDTSDHNDASKRHHRGIFIRGTEGSSQLAPSSLAHSNITLKRLVVSSCGSDGIQIGGVDGLYAEDLNLYDNGWNDDGDFWHNMYVVLGNNIVMKQTSSTGGGFRSSPSGHGLRLSRLNDVYIENLRITENADHGLHMNDVTDLRGYGLNVFDNCRIPNGGCKERACYGDCSVDLTTDKE